MAKANSVAIPEGFNPADPASVAAAFALVPSNGADAFTLTQGDIHIIGPTLIFERGSAFAGGYARLTTVPYALVLPAESFSLATGGVVVGVENDFEGETGILLELAVFSQSSVYFENDPATNANMIDNSILGDATGTNRSAEEWVQVDFGAEYPIDRVVIGTATDQMAGGWDKSYTENKDVEYSLNGTTWTFLFNTGTFENEGIYAFTVDVAARYLRVFVEDDYIGLTEFYALSPGQVVLLPVVSDDFFIASGGYADSLPDDVTEQATLATGAVAIALVDIEENSLIYTGSTALYLPDLVIGQAYEGGYFAGFFSENANGEASHALVVAPKESGEAIDLPYKIFNDQTIGTESLSDGPANTAAMDITHPAATFCKNLSINGYSDWYLPALWELEIAYFNLKPGDQPNFTADYSFTRNGNPHAVPIRTAGYTSAIPALTTASNFWGGNGSLVNEGDGQPGEGDPPLGSQRFRYRRYWTSSEGESKTTAAYINMEIGAIFAAPKTGLGGPPPFAVRAFRRAPLPE